MTGAAGAGLEVRESRDWSAEESARFAEPALDHFASFARHSTARTVLTFAKAWRGGELVGVAPVTRVLKYRGTRLLEERSRRWLDPLLGPFARKTTALVDATFMAFRFREPFCALAPEDARPLREAVVAHLMRCRDVENLMITEPLGDPAWARSNGFFVFRQLPTVHVELEGCGSFDDHLARVGQKRRRNVRKERELFEREGGTFELHEAPVPAELVGELHRLLLASARNNRQLEVPYEDVMNSEPAFRAQLQSAIVARVGGEIAGFFAFLPNGDVMQQCHGGLDYERSLRVKAYPNLIHAAVEHALSRGMRLVTLGPLNNEAKRRAGSLHPTMASFWCRDALSRWLSRKVLVPRFQVYGGALEA